MWVELRWDEESLCRVRKCELIWVDFMRIEVNLLSYVVSHYIEPNFVNRFIWLVNPWGHLPLSTENQLWGVSTSGHCHGYPGAMSCSQYNDVIKWKYFPHFWPFVRGIYRLPVNSPHKGQWPFMFSLSCARINGWVSNREAGDLRRHHAHHDVIVMKFLQLIWISGMRRWNGRVSDLQMSCSDFT